LPLLAELAEAETIRPEVIYKFIVRIEADVRRLSNYNSVSGLPEPDKAFACKVAREAPAYIKAVRAKLGLPVPSTPALEKTPEWASVVDMWNLPPVFLRCGGADTFDEIAHHKRIGQAETAIETLRLAGRLSRAEANLLKLEASWRQVMRHEPVKCFGEINRARLFLTYQKSRLIYLRRLTAATKVTSVVLETLTPHIRDVQGYLLSTERFKAKGVSSNTISAAGSVARRAAALMQKLKRKPIR
jgi:hypothetical protein